MKTNEQLAEAQAYHDAGLKRVATTPEPKEQKFPKGTRVRIGRQGAFRGNFPRLRNATVEYTYAPAYGGDDVELYSLDVDGIGSVAWYHESQLTRIAE